MQFVRASRHFARAVVRAAGSLRGSVGVAVVTPTETGEAAADEINLEIQQWSWYRGELLVELHVPRAEGERLARYVFFSFGERSLRFRLKPGELQQFSLPADPNVALLLGYRDGRVVRVPEPAARALIGDPTHALFGRFLREAGDLPAGRALELGSRARSGTTYRHLVPEQLAYTGMDIVEGPNVDVVGDAHELAALFAPGEFNLVFCIAVFEHLAMPWKAALAINEVLADGGLFFAGTHQTFPVHEAPWDFWRFSDRAWHSVFNAATGFEILDTAMGEPASIVPHAAVASVVGIESQPAYLSSSVLARKVGPARVRWDVQLADLSDEGLYPN